MATITKKKILKFFISSMVVLLFMLLCVSCKTKEENKITSNEYISLSEFPDDVYNYCPLTIEEFSNWFVNDLVTLDGKVKFADSKNFPSQNTNCDFYKWSEQMFLWITSPSSETTRVFDSETFFDVSPAIDNKRKLIPHEPGEFRNFSPAIRQNGPQRLPVKAHPKTGQLLEIDTPLLSANGKQLIENNVGDNVEFEKAEIVANKIIFFDKNGNEIVGAKPLFNKGLNTKNLVQQYTINGKAVYVNALGAVVDETEQGQAGGGDVLMTQNGSLVYYTILVNDIYAVFKTMFPDSIRFPDSTAELDEIVAYGKTLGIDISDANALAIELKMSWVNIESLANPELYVQTKAYIPVYNTSDTDLWKKTGDEIAVLALVGVHIVGNVAGHPEMLWSTFEHLNNSPMGTYSYINTEKTTINIPSDTYGDWSFSESGAAQPFNKIHMSVDGLNIEAKNGFTISASNTLRDNPWGVVAGSVPNQNVSSAAQSNSEIISINNNVINMLMAGDVRMNYFQIGNTWTNGGALPTGQYPVGNEIGTSNLANSTMETYHQNVNCFTCHTTSTPNDYTGLSHIFGEIVPLLKDVTKN